VTLDKRDKPWGQKEVPGLSILHLLLGWDIMLYEPWVPPAAQESETLDKRDKPWGQQEVPGTSILHMLLGWDIMLYETWVPPVAQESCSSQLCLLLESCWTPLIACLTQEYTGMPIEFTESWLRENWFMVASTVMVTQLLRDRLYIMSPSIQSFTINSSPFLGSWGIQYKQ
jgi:hypothetical protein